MQPHMPCAFFSPVPTYPSLLRCNAQERGSASRPASDAPSGRAACSAFLRNVRRRCAPPDPAGSRASRNARDDEAVPTLLRSILLQVAGSLARRFGLDARPGTRGVRRRFAVLTLRRSGSAARRRAPAISGLRAPDRCAVARNPCWPATPRARWAAGTPLVPSWDGTTSPASCIRAAFRTYPRRRAISGGLVDVRQSQRSARFTPRPLQIGKSLTAVSTVSLLRLTMDFCRSAKVPSDGGNR